MNDIPIGYTLDGQPVYWSDVTHVPPLTAPVMGFTPHRDSGKVSSTHLLRRAEARRCAAQQGTQPQRLTAYLVLQSDVGITDEQVEAAVAKLQRMGIGAETT